MAKKIWNRIVWGFGLTVVICMGVHFLLGECTGQAVTDEFRALFRSEGSATLAQLFLTGLIGAAFASGSLIFEIERWSYLRQGLVHFLLTAAVWMPVSWICRWIPTEAGPILWTVGGWTLTYSINWLVQYFIYRRRIADLNRRIQDYQQEVGDSHEGH